MRNILNDFHFVPDGATSLVDALCRFIKEEITTLKMVGVALGIGGALLMLFM